MVSLFSKTGKLVRDLEQNLNSLTNTLNEVSAAFVADGREVPQEVAQAMGHVQHRRYLFSKVRNILLEQSGGPGTEKVVAQYLNSIKPQSEEIEKLFAALEVVAKEGSNNGK